MYILTMPSISLFCILQLFACCLASLNLTVLHVNDIHARFEETSKYSGNCDASQKGDINISSGNLVRYNEPKVTLFQEKGNVMADWPD